MTEMHPHWKATIDDEMPEQSASFARARTKHRAGSRLPSAIVGILLVATLGVLYVQAPGGDAQGNAAAKTRSKVVSSAPAAPAPPTAPTAENTTTQLIVQANSNTSSSIASTQGPTLDVGGAVTPSSPETTTASFQPHLAAPNTLSPVPSSVFSPTLDLHLTQETSSLSSEPAITELTVPVTNPYKVGAWQTLSDSFHEAARVPLSQFAQPMSQQYLASLPRPPTQPESGPNLWTILIGFTLVCAFATRKYWYA